MVKADVKLWCRIVCI